MNLALRSAVYGDLGPAQAARAIAAAGYDTVLLSLDAHGLGPAESLTEPLAKRVAEDFEGAGVTIGALTASCDLVNGGEAAQDRLHRLIRLSRPFDTALLVAGNGPGDDWTALFERLRDVTADAEDNDVVIVIELGSNQAVRDLDQAELLLDTIECDALGLSLDILAIAAEHDISVTDVLDRVGDALVVVGLSEVDEHGNVEPPSPGGGTDYGELFDQLGEYAPDAIIVPGGVTASNAGATASFLARLL